MPAMLSEGSLLLYFLCTALGLVCLAVFWSTRQTKLLVGVAVAVLVAAGLFTIDMAIETDREQVERKLQELATAANHGDVDSLGTHFDPAFKSGEFLSRDRLLDQARKYLKAGEQRRVTLGTPDIKLQGSQRLTATSDYTAQGFFGGQEMPPQLGKIEFTYVKGSDGQWRIESMRLLTMQGDPRGFPR